MKVCVWHNRAKGCYEILSYNHNKRTKKVIRDGAWEILKKRYAFSEIEKDRVLETLYLVDIDAFNLIKE